MKIKLIANSDHSILMDANAASFVDGFQCPFTKKLFADREKYIAHLKLYRSTVVAKKVFEASAARFYTSIRHLGSLDEVCDFIYDNSYKMILYALMRDSRFTDAFKKNTKRVQKTLEIIKYVRVKISLDVRYNEHISNTHSAPLDGFTNYRGDLTMPTGYPGLSGRIGIKFVHDSTVNRNEVIHALDPVLGSDIFDDQHYSSSLCGINTASGGGGSLDYSYDVKMFLSDWPNLANNINQQITFERVIGTRQMDDNKWSFVRHIV